MKETPALEVTVLFVTVPASPVDNLLCLCPDGHQTVADQDPGGRAAEEG